MSHTKITLLLPGYTVKHPAFVDQGQPTDGSTSDYFVSGNSAQPLHQAPATFTFLEDLERQPWQAQMAQMLGLDTSGGQSLPSARLGMRHTEGVSVPSQLANAKELVRADPISLKADRDNATLISSDQLLLTEDESEQLITALNQFLAEDGLTFFRRGAVEWYMSGRSAEDLESYPPSFLANRNASAFLPDGEAAAPWRRLMTEIQMLLHAHPVNQLREQRGQTPVNSVWFWGGAPLSEPASERTDIIMYADEYQARSLAQHLGIRCRALDKLHADLQTDINSFTRISNVIVIDLSIVNAWLNADVQQLEAELSRVHEQWLQPMARQICNAELVQVTLLTEDGLQGICNTQTQPPEMSGWDVWTQRFRRLFQR